ncbi:carbohydrate binding domain CBM49 domain-containing protein [Ditylenchus destructor]|uniref:Carbohydrate binding domain CBM49 domain-containing protein n=1 Tax=Ditylenchus destructor TaxID=166010 RepID=A0AAD4N5M5_9BILA|nr:carbohydrate binding domain CBM49 domain-containing protein [Ditylenchus destructor]
MQFLALAFTFGAFLTASDAGLIEAQLNKPVPDSVFTFYGAAGRGACGLDISSCSAAASGSLFDPNAEWVPSNLPDGRYILNDPICKGICIKVEYKGKTAVFPIDNKCPECPVNHVDLSETAFLVLEPLGGTVGKATGATLTYLLCNQTTISSCNGAATAGPTTYAPTTKLSDTTTKAPSAVSTTKSSSATTPSNGGGNSGKLSVSATVASSWNGGMQLALVFTNNDSKSVCSVTFSIALQSGQTISSSWNMENGSTDNEYKLPSWVNIGGGEQYSSSGLNIDGGGSNPPTVSVVSYGYC